MSFTKSTAVRNSSATLNLYAPQAANIIDASGPDEKMFIIAKNNSVTAANTMYLVIPQGDFVGADAGELVVTVANGGDAHVIGPLDGSRFKNSAGNVIVNVAVTSSGGLGETQMAVVDLP